MGQAYPLCQKCKVGELIPLGLEVNQGGPGNYGAWFCNNPDCRFNVKMRNGDIFINEPVTDASANPNGTSGSSTAC